MIKKYTNEQGLLHREDGPAIEWDNGDKYWFINSSRHREDGPAVEYANGDKEWWLEGKHVDCSSTEEFLRLCKLKIFW